MNRLSLLLTLAITHLFCTDATETRAAAKFPQTRQVGDTLYLSAQGNRNPKTGERSSDMGAATRQVMLNLKRELDANGYDFSDVVASHVWLTDLGKYQQMNSVYRSFFSNQFPVRTTVGVSGLPGESPVQIAMVAFKGPRKVIFPHGATPADLPFSPGILAGDTLYLSGHAGIDPQTGKLVEGDMRTHVLQTLRNTQGVLQAAGMDFEHVVSAYVFVQDLDQFSEASEAYLSVFDTEPRPARMPMGVAAIPLNSPVEITLIASRKPRQALLGEGQPFSGGYSRGLLNGDTLHLAGIYRRKGTIQDQVDSALEWIRSLLTAGDMGVENMAELRVYLSDINNETMVREACKKHFSVSSPALSVIGVPRLPADCEIMMGVVAARQSAK